MGSRVQISKMMTVAMTAYALLSAPQAVAFQAPVLDAAPEPVAQPATPPAPLTVVPAQRAPSAGPLLPATAAVDLYYRARSNAPLWFRDASTRQAAKLLPTILRRGEIEDGTLVFGPAKGERSPREAEELVA